MTQIGQRTVRFFGHYGVKMTVHLSDPSLFSLYDLVYARHFSPALSSAHDCGKQS